MSISASAKRTGQLKNQAHTVLRNYVKECTAVLAEVDRALRETNDVETVGVLLELKRQTSKALRESNVLANGVKRLLDISEKFTIELEK